jgi:hypothetical protein
MLRSRALVLLLGLLLGLALAWAGQAVTRTELFAAMSRGAVPAPPTFPARVVPGPFVEGHQRVVLGSLSFTYSALIRTHLGSARAGLEEQHLLRHRSLELPDFGVGRNDPGLLAGLVADAEAKGWRVVPELTVDAGVAYQAVGLRQGGWLFLVLGFGDALASVEGNPGASMSVANQAYACCEGGRCPEPSGPPESPGPLGQSGPPEPAASGLAPCPVEGFVPLLVWTNLPGASGAAASWLHPEARGLAADERAWDDPPGWEEHVARAAGG